MKSEFLLGAAAVAVASIAAAISAATIAEPPAAEASAEPEPAPQPNVRTRTTTQELPGGMGGIAVTAVDSGPPIVVPGSSMPKPPPIVAIPRHPGDPGDLMVPEGDRELRTVQSFARIEDCDVALASYRRHRSDAVCVSTAPPPPEPDHAELLVIGEGEELLGIQSFPDMPACERARASQTPRPGQQIVCTKVDWH